MKQKIHRPCRFDGAADSRRAALRTIAAGAGGALLLGTASLPSGANPLPPAPGTNSVPATVALAHRAGLLDRSGRYVPSLLDEALSSALAAATGEESGLAALRSLFSARDRVGIKINALAGRGLSPRPELTERLTDMLVDCGIDPRSILVFDRDDRELLAAGYRIVRRGKSVRCYGTGAEYEWTPREWGAGGSCFARALGEMTALINIGVLKDHDLAGVSAGMKNWYGVIHNPNKHHDDGCHPFVAHLAAADPIRSRLKLTILDAATAQAHGGPARSDQWIWPCETILASRDPVALDTVALALIEEQRQKAGLPTLAAAGRTPLWLQEAARLGLGEARPGKIRRTGA